VPRGPADAFGPHIPAAPCVPPSRRPAELLCPRLPGGDHRHLCRAPHIMTPTASTPWWRPPSRPCSFDAEAERNAVSARITSGPGGGHLRQPRDRGRVPDPGRASPGRRRHHAQRCRPDAAPALYSFADVQRGASLVEPGRGLCRRGRWPWGDCGPPGAGRHRHHGRRAARLRVAGAAAEVLAGRGGAQRRHRSSPWAPSTLAHAVNDRTTMPLLGTITSLMLMAGLAAAFGAAADLGCSPPRPLPSRSSWRLQNRQQR
jgi:hypothetical protein